MGNLGNYMGKQHKVERPKTPIKGQEVFDLFEIYKQRSFLCAQMCRGEIGMGVYQVEQSRHHAPVYRWWQSKYGLRRKKGGE